MDNPPVPIRPWFRLASQIRVDPPAQRNLTSVRSTVVQPPPAVPVPPPVVSQPERQPSPAAAPVAPPVPAPAPAPVQLTEPPPRVPAVPVPAQVMEPPPRAPVQVTEPPPESPKPRAVPTVKTSVPTPPPSSMPVPASPVPKPSPLPSKPSSPIYKTASPSQSKSSKPTSPKPVTNNYSPLKSPKKPSPGPVAPIDEYLKIVNPSSPQSPKLKNFASPPSPLSLPPSQLNPVPEPESKTVLMTEHKNVNERNRNKAENLWNHTGTTNVSTHSNQNGAAGGVAYHKKSSEDEEQGVRMITIAGENKGAYMELGSSKKNTKLLPHQVNKNGFHKINKGNEHESSFSSSNDEVTSKKENKGMTTSTTRPTKAYVNSNVQGVNNSILFNSSCAHSNPGVHLVFSKNNPTIAKD